MKGGRGGLSSQRIPNSVPNKVKVLQNISTVIRGTKEDKLNREPKSGSIWKESWFVHPVPWFFPIICCYLGFSCLTDHLQSFVRHCWCEHWYFQLWFLLVIFSLLSRSFLPSFCGQLGYSSSGIGVQSSWKFQFGPFDVPRRCLPSWLWSFR